MSSNANEDDLPTNSNLNNTTNKCLDLEADVKEMARAILFGQENHRSLVADAKPAPNIKPLPADDDDDDDDDEFNSLIDSTIHDPHPHPHPRPYDVHPSTVVLLRSFSVNNTLGDNEQALLEIINAHVTNGKMRELLTIYEKALDIEPIMPRLGNTWKKGNRNIRKNLTRYHAWKMHKSLEANISEHLGERFEFISILHFTLFMLANNGYVRKHRESCAKETKWGQIKNKPIGRSYYTIAKILNKTLA
jgi:hypothetical protein